MVLAEPRIKFPSISLLSLLGTFLRGGEPYFKVVLDYKTSLIRRGWTYSKKQVLKFEGTGADVRHKVLVTSSHAFAITPVIFCVKKETVKLGVKRHWT